MIADFGVFLALALVLVVTPGADTTIILRNAIRGGRAHGIRTSLGVCSGLIVHCTGAALGLSVIIARSAAVYDLIKLAGLVYLALLAAASLRSWLRAERGPTTRTPQQELPSVKPGSALAQGILSNVLNPKVALFFIAFLPQFVVPGPTAVLDYVVLTVTLGAMGFAWFVLLVLLATAARGWLARPRVRGRIDGAAGAALGAFGLRLALSRAPL